MALVKTNAVLTAQADNLTGLIDASVPAAYMELQTAGGVEVATIVFGDPSFGGAVNGLATINATTPDGSATGNVSPITKFVVYNGAGVEQYRGTVTITAGGGDIEADSVVIGAGATVTLTSYTYQEA